MLTLLWRLSFPGCSMAETGSGEVSKFQSNLSFFYPEKTWKTDLCDEERIQVVIFIFPPTKETARDCLNAAQALDRVCF